MRQTEATRKTMPKKCYFLEVENFEIRSTQTAKVEMALPQEVMGPPGCG